MTENLYDGNPHVVGNSIYQKCHDCGDLVKINKWFLGSMHICSEERARREGRLG